MDHARFQRELLEILTRLVELLRMFVDSFDDARNRELEEVSRLSYEAGVLEGRSQPGF